jgi:hypothetical protein
MHFAFDERKVAAVYARDKVRIGGIVYLLAEEGAEPQFSPVAFKNSRPYCVTWISTSDWTVYLLDRLVVTEHDVHRIAAVLAGAMSQDNVRKALYFSAGQVPVGKLHLGDTWHNSIPGKCLAVAERLQFVSDLHTPDVEMVVWWHSESLITYLLLTCFDILGQSRGWYDFGSWLKQKTEDGPELAQVASGDPVATSEQLYEQWLVKFGIKNSFYRFINERLDQSTRQKLLDSLTIKKYGLPPDSDLSRQSQIPVTGEEKLRYLYKVRNAFTHQARGVPGKYPAVKRGPVTGRGQTIEGRHFKSYATADWPNVLIDSVRFGLVAILREQLASAPADLKVPKELPTTPGRRNYA